MLVLSRKMGERIVIGENIVLEICNIRHNKVSIGIEAPANVHVFREEILTRNYLSPEPEPNQEESKKDKST